MAAQEYRTRPERYEQSVPDRRVPSASKPGKQINWNGVVKGALIVTAVVAVAVVGATMAASFVGGASAAAATGTTGPAAGFGAVINGLASAASWSFQAVLGVGNYVWTAVSTYTGSLLTGLGFTTPLAAPGVAVASETVGGIAGWLGGIGASLVALPIAAKQLLSINLLEPSTTTAAADMAAGAAAAKSVHMQGNHMFTGDVYHHHHVDGQPQQPQTADADHGVDMMDDAVTAATANKASKLAVAHGVEEQHERHEALMRARRQNAEFREHADAAWQDKVGGRKAPTTYQSRSGQSFAQNHEADLAREQALASTTVRA